MYLRSSPCGFQLTSRGYFGDHKRPNAVPFPVRLAGALDSILPPAGGVDFLHELLIRNAQIQAAWRHLAYSGLRGETRCKER